MDDDLRGDLGAALSTLESGPNETSQAPSPGPAPSGPAEGTLRSGYSAPAPAGDTSVATTPQVQVPQSGQQNPSQGLTPPPPRFKAPQSWKPERREKFSKLEMDIQEEIDRREKEIEQGLRMSSDNRRFKEQFDQLTQPYQQFFAAEGAQPIDGFKNYLQTAAALRVGSPAQKAQIVAGIIQQFGVPIETLDSLLSGNIQTSQQAPDPILQTVQQQLAPIQQFMQQFQQRQQEVQQKTNQQLEQELESFFSDPNFEFANDLRHEIADVLELSANRGQQISLHDAYNRATLLHPEIAKVIADRKLKQAAQSQSAAAQQAANAAVSVRGDAPSQSGNTANHDNLRSSLEAAWDTAGTRR